MKQNDFISQILLKHFPENCEVVGPSNLSDIASSDVRFIDVKSGSYMDLGETISGLVVAATFVKTILDIYRGLKRDLRRKPKRPEYETKLMTIKETRSQLTILIKEEIITEVFNHGDEIEEEK